MGCFGTKKIVLYIDDDRDSMSYLDMILPDGYDLQACDYSMLLQTESYHLDATLLVIDPDYRGGNGLLLLSMFAQRFPCLPILAYSYSNQPSLVSRTIISGAKHFNCKPINKVELWSVLARSQRTFSQTKNGLQGIKQLPRIIKVKDPKRCLYVSKDWGPVLIAGESGTGKTTLALALASCDDRLGIPLCFDGRKDKLADLKHLSRSSCIVLENLSHFNKRNLLRIGSLIHDRISLRPIKLIATITIPWGTMVSNKYRYVLGEDCGLLTMIPLRERIEELYSLVLELGSNHNTIDWKALFKHKWPGNLVELELYLRGSALF